MTADTARIDEDLAALGKSEQEITAVRARAPSGQALDAVDAELAALAADLEGAQALLERASARVPAVRGTFEKGAAAPPPSTAAAEPVFQEAPWGEAGAAPEDAAAHSLSADDLFGDAEGGGNEPGGPLTEDPSLSQPPPAPGEGGGDEDSEGGLADLLEGDDEPVVSPPPEPAAAASAPTDFDISDSTDMMSADEVEAIRTSVAPDAAADDDIEVLDEDEFEILVDDDDL
jgi:hypothetical protein